MFDPRMPIQYQNELKQCALVDFYKVCVPGLDLLFSFGWLVLCLLFGVHMVLAVLDHLC